MPCRSPARPEVTLNGTARLVVRPLAAALAGMAVAGAGVGASFLVAGSMDSGPSMGDVVVAVLGTFASVAAGVVVWLVLLVVAARRLFGPGERLGPVMLSAGGVLGVAVVGAVVAGAQGDAFTAGPLVVLVSAGTAALALPSAVFVLRGRTTPRPGPPTGWPLPPV